MKVITIHSVQNIEYCTFFTDSLPRHSLWTKGTFFVLQAVVGNLRASRNLESISLSRGGHNKRERHESDRRIDWKKKYFFPVYFVSAVKKKNASVGKHFCVAGVSTAVILKARFSTDSICIESDGGMLWCHMQEQYSKTGLMTAI